MHMKTIRSVMYSGLVSLTVVAAMSAQALQTVDPKLSLAGASINGSTQAVPAGTTFTVYGVYSDDSTNPESGLGLKVKYNGTHLTGVTISEEYTKCRIAVADVQNPTTATAQAVMGWIDTAIRPNGVVGSATGAVGWPDLADLASGGCLNPGSINTDTAAAAATGLKLFKMTGTMALGCQSVACTSTVTFDSEGNYSYANAGAGFTNKSFTIVGAPAPTIALTAAASTRVHGATGTFDVVVTSASQAGANSLAEVAVAAGDTTITVEPRSPGAGNSYTVAMDFNAAVTSGTASVVACNYWTGSASAPCPASPTLGTVTFAGSRASIPLTGVTNQSRVQVRLSNVNAQGYNADMTVGFLIGDVTNSRAVNGTDASQVSLKSGQTVSAANAKYDITGNGGTINGTDASQASLRSGTRLP